MTIKKDKPEIVLMHVIDAGFGMPDFPYGAQYECSKCGHKTKWICSETLEESKTHPCPNCNKGEQYDTE